MTRLREADAKKRAESDYSADFSEALARGINVITAFDANRRQMTLSDIARVIDLPRATVRRALYTLARLGYLETEGKIFRLSPKILNLAVAYLASNPISSILQPVCERVCAQIDVTCSVAVLDGDEAVMIARASPARPVTVGLGVGYRLPAFSSALGRVLLGTFDDQQLETYFARVTPTQVTGRTTVDKLQLRQIIRDVKTHGFSLVDQETEIGFRSLAVPLLRYDGAPIAAMNIGTQVERASLETMLNQYLPLLRHEAAELKNQLI